MNMDLGVNLGLGINSGNVFLERNKKGKNIKNIKNNGKICPYGAYMSWGP